MDNSALEAWSAVVATVLARLASISESLELIARARNPVPMMAAAEVAAFREEFNRHSNYIPAGPTSPPPECFVPETKLGMSDAEIVFRLAQGDIALIKTILRDELRFAKDHGMENRDAVARRRRILNILEGTESPPIPDSSVAFIAQTGPNPPMPPVPPGLRMPYTEWCLRNGLDPKDERESCDRCGRSFGGTREEGKPLWCPTCTMEVKDSAINAKTSAIILCLKLGHVSHSQVDGRCARCREPLDG